MKSQTAKLAASSSASRFGKAMIAPTLLVMLVMTAYPLVFTLFYSFTDYNYLKGTDKASFVLFDNFTSLFANGYFRQAVVNTIVFTLLAVLFEMALGLLAAVFVNGLTKGQKMMRTLLLLPYLLPAVTVALSWRMMLSSNYGIVNQALSALGLPVFNWFMDTKTAFGTMCRLFFCCFMLLCNRCPRASMRRRVSTALAQYSGSAMSRCRISRAALRCVRC